MNAHDLHQALTATGQYIVQLGRTATDPADEEGLHSVIIDGTFDLHALAAALTPPIPEDTDLEAIAARVAAARAAMSGDSEEWIVFATRENWAAEEQLFFGPDNVPPVGKVLEGIALAEFVAHAWQDVPALLARVRTAEAERDEAQRRLGVIADSARDGLEDCDDDYDMSAYWVLMVATGHFEESTRPRTVETAEEPRLNPRVVLASIDNMLEPMTTHRGTHLAILKRRLSQLREQVAQYVPLQPVPPTPEGKP